MKRFQALIGYLAVLAAIALVLTTCSRSSPSNTPPAGGSLTVTLADEGQTVTLRVGESFLLKLGEDYDWTVTVDDQSIVSRAKGITVVRGAQGVYDGLRVGRTALSAVGDPVCRQADPPCEQPSRTFRIQIVVQ